VASRKISKKRKAVNPGKQPSRGKKATRALTKKRREAAQKGWVTRKVRAYEKVEREAIVIESDEPPPSSRSAKRDLLKDLQKGRKLNQKASMPRHTPKVDKEGFITLETGSPQQRGWATRRKKTLLKQGLSPLSARDWSTLSKPQAEHLETFIEKFWGTPAYRYGKMRSDYFRTLIERHDNRISFYLEACDQMGYTSRQARTAMFSPKARKK